MIIKCHIQLYNSDGNLRSSEDKDVEINSSWYTPQCYFNDNYKEELTDSDSDLSLVVLKWQNKTYEFKTRK